MDWILLTIWGLLGFLMWHIMVTPHTYVDDAVTVILPPSSSSNTTSSIHKGPTIYAEPGISGKIVDPVQPRGDTPETSLAFSSVAMPFA